MSDTNNRYQRLASALYLVTGFFAEQEPLRLKLRTLAADLVVGNGKGERENFRECLSLLALAQTAGLISSPNYEILLAQFNKVVETQEGSLLDFFPTYEPALPSREERQALPRPLAKTEVVKDNISEPVDKTSEGRQELLKDFGAVSVKKNSRQSVIISLLKRKKEIMIKDVSPLIAGCSEKTIQRELSQMVSAGILKKIGEKRWTRYTLA